MSDLTELRDHARFMAAHREPVGIALMPTFTRTLKKPIWRIPVPTDAERILWTQIADEIDAYLTPDDDSQEALL